MLVGTTAVRGQSSSKAECDERKKFTPVKKRKRAKQKLSPEFSMTPPLSASAAVEFDEEEREQYKSRLHVLGQDTVDMIDFPLSSSLEEKKRPNNRAPGWNGVFAFTFYWKEADQNTRQAILQSLTVDYGGEISEGEIGPGSWDVCIRTTGKRVKAVTRMLNRQYAKGYLVWREKPR